MDCADYRKKASLLRPVQALTCYPQRPIAGRNANDALSQQCEWLMGLVHSGIGAFFGAHLQLALAILRPLLSTDGNLVNL